MDILILEDDPARIEIFQASLEGRHTLAVATTAADAIMLLNATRFDAVFLDHDLGGETYVSEANVNTGSEVVRYLATRCDYMFETIIIVHTMNFPAGSRMVDRLLSAGYEKTHRIPFAVLVSNYLHDPGFL